MASETSSRLQGFADALDTLSRSLLKMEGRRDEIVARIEQAKVSIATAEEDVEVLEQVVALLQGLEESWQKLFQKSVARVISRGLSLVFEEPMELIIQPKVRADVTTVDFRIAQGEGKSRIETNVIGAKGGTVVVLVAVLLRALLILSSHPPLRRILILDEPFANADPKIIPAFGDLLRELCERLGFQIIIVSHEDALVDAADVAYEVYEVSAKKGSSFRQIKTRNDTIT